MINSSISSAHFFYLVFIKSDKIKSIKGLMAGFEEQKQFEKHKTDKSESYTHYQIEIPQTYGSPILLIPNKAGIIEGRQAYWYDFYVGSFQSDLETVFYLVYPYAKMGKYIEKAISKIDRQAIFSKPKLSAIIPFLKRLKNSKVNGASIKIIKYGAEVKEDNNRINIIGTTTSPTHNPLNSAVLIALEEKNIVVEPIGLKLGYTLDNLKGIELAFDRLGNYRFWLKTNGQKDVFSTIPQAFQFFKSSKTLEDSLFISSYTLLEDNDH